MIDSTIVHAHQHSAGDRKTGEDRVIGLARRIGRQIHATVDALGDPTDFFLTGGQAHDLVGANHLMAHVQVGTRIAEKAFDADERVIQSLHAASKTAVVPPIKDCKSPRGYDRDLHKARHLIESFFAKLGLFRAIASFGPIEDRL